MTLSGQQLFVVMASTGEYSSRHVWSVCGYLNKAAAEAHVASAEQWARENKVAYRLSGFDMLPYEEREQLHSPWDERVNAGGGEGIEIDYNGLRYWCETVPAVFDGADGEAVAFGPRAIRLREEPA